VDQANHGTSPAHKVSQGTDLISRERVIWPDPQDHRFELSFCKICQGRCRIGGDTDQANFKKFTGLQDTAQGAYRFLMRRLTPGHY